MREIMMAFRTPILAALLVGCTQTTPSVPAVVVDECRGLSWFDPLPTQAAAIGFSTVTECAMGLRPIERGNAVFQALIVPSGRYLDSRIVLRIERIGMGAVRTVAASGLCDTDSLLARHEWLRPIPRGEVLPPPPTAAQTESAEAILAEPIGELDYHRVDRLPRSAFRSIVEWADASDFWNQADESGDLGWMVKLWGQNGELGNSITFFGIRDANPVYSAILKELVPLEEFRCDGPGGDGFNPFVDA